MPLPEVPGWFAWKQSVENKLIAAIDLDEDYVYEWLRKIFDPATKVEELRKIPRRLRRLDAKFRSSLMDILKGEINKK